MHAFWQFLKEKALVNIRIGLVLAIDVAVSATGLVPDSFLSTRAF
jgi:hypothetical protein